ncbi:MAG: hypothetical protein KIS78_09405 [Labilithrix sp.]|nr:hypothetical protein [Labilithrix sp.]
MALAGIEVDNLLSFLALVGVLRALEEAEPTWAPRASWIGPPWRAQLHLESHVDEDAVAAAARKGIDSLVARYDVGGRSDVNFEGDEFRTYLEVQEREPTGVGLELATAISAELPRKKSGGPRSAPLVMMFGQGHQHFLDRLISVPKGVLPAKLKKLKSPPKLDDPKWLAQALFQPWMRADTTDGFRWDPEDDQRYALRAGNPSDDGAAPTVHGANQLASVGLLSFTSFPHARRRQTRGAISSSGSVDFVWPIWSEPLERRAIEHLLGHGDVLAGRIHKVRDMGVKEIFRARRVANGKFMNVARARPATPPTERGR